MDSHNALSFTRSFWLGILASLIGGIPVVVIMGSVGMFSKLAAFLGLGDSLLTGVLIHFGISLVYGLPVGIAFYWAHNDGFPRLSLGWLALVIGLVYGLLTWVIAFTNMPMVMSGEAFFLGFDPGKIFTFTYLRAISISLLGHLIYGLATTYSFVWLARRIDITGARPALRVRLPQALLWGVLGSLVGSLAVLLGLSQLGFYSALADFFGLGQSPGYGLFFHAVFAVLYGLPPGAAFYWAANYGWRKLDFGPAALTLGGVWGGLLALVAYAALPLVITGEAVLAGFAPAAWSTDLYLQAMGLSFISHLAYGLIAGGLLGWLAGRGDRSAGTPGAAH